MAPEEIRIRSLYLFLACSQAVEEFKNRLVPTLPGAAPLSTASAERLLRREIGLLFRYWMTRQIWQRLEAQEADAKHLNLALLRLFVERLRLPGDGSGLRYAELSISTEEVEELGRRITRALGVEHPPLLTELRGAILPWRQAVLKQTTDGLTLPVPVLAALVRQWSERAPEPAR